MGRRGGLLPCVLFTQIATTYFGTVFATAGTVPRWLGVGAGEEGQRLGATS